MATAIQQMGGGAPAPPTRSTSLASWVFRLAGLAFIDAVALWFLPQMLSYGYYSLAVAVGIVTLLINFVFLFERFYPLRWISPGLALMILMVVYPVFFTFVISFTNYGQGHLVTKEIAIQQIESQVYLPADAQIYNWTAYQNAAGEYMLWMTDPVTGEVFTVTPGTDPVLREGTPPPELDGYTLVPQNQLFAKLGELSALTFGLEEDSFKVSQTKLGEAAKYQQRYVYDAEQDAMIDQETGEVYANVEGTFTSPSGVRLTPGFAVSVSGYNYSRLVTDPGLRENFVTVFTWTVVFALMSVFLTFVVGLFLAIMFDVPEMPARSLVRALLLIPYTIPAFVSVPVWVGLLNPQYGVVSQWIATLTGGWVPPWFSDPFWSKAGILLIQTWLGFPYMFVIITGALQTLPNDIYEAADLDGANAWQKFRAMTLPLLLVTVGPLLVASFAFNFNNFTVIDLYNQGRPPIPNATIPVGYTDILATYTYRIAFGSTGSTDYGYASAITVIIFLILVVITLFQFRFTNRMEERGRNV